MLSLSLSLQAQTPATYAPDWESLDRRPTPQWWKDAKFGIFIHWGVYSVPAFTPKGRYSEWYLQSLTENDPDGALKRFHQANFPGKTYYDLADQFSASQFDPDAWAKLFQDAGARYVVLTSKHHDGFCLWPNQHANAAWGMPWNAAERGPRRDLVGELSAALRKTEVRPGLYFSLYEWYNPLWKLDKTRYAAEHAMPQLYELVQQYRPEVIWADGDWDATPEQWQSKQFLAWLYNSSPVRDVVVANDRWGSGVRFKHAGIYTPEYQPDLAFEDHDWEESRGMGYSYGYNRAEDARDYTSSQLLILHLIDKVSKGGNFLLDIGPDSYGQIPPIMQERLLDIGRWLQVNGEAIYGTRRWRQPSQWSAGRRDFTPEQIDGWKTSGDALAKVTLSPDPGFAVKEVFFTHSPVTNALYAILPQYPSNKKLTLRNLRFPAGTEVTLLATKDKLRWENIGEDVVISLPEYQPARMKESAAFVVKIGKFGAFSAKTVIHVEYDRATMRPTITMKSAPGASIRYTLDGSEPTEASPEFSVPITPDKTTKVRARAWQKGLIPGNETETTAYAYALFPALSFIQPPKPGLLGQLHNVDQHTCASVEATPVTAAGIVYGFTLDPQCTQQCGIVWQGYLQLDQTTGYDFQLASDDGSMLYIDNQLIINNDGDHGSEEKNGRAFLQRGWHAIKVVYFNSGGTADLKVRFAPVGEPLQEIPAGIMGH